MSMLSTTNFALGNAFNIVNNPAVGQSQRSANGFLTGAQIFGREASMYPPGSPYADILGSTANIMAGVGQIANVTPILQSYAARKQAEAAQQAALMQLLQQAGANGGLNVAAGGGVASGMQGGAGGIMQLLALLVGLFQQLGGQQAQPGGQLA